MTLLRNLIAAATVLLAALLSGQQQTPRSLPRPTGNQPPRVRFTTLPGFSIERVVPAQKTDSLIVLTFDSLGRPVVSKENDHPRTLIDGDGDGVFESESLHRQSPELSGSLV